MVPSPRSLSTLGLISVAGISLAACGTTSPEAGRSLATEPPLASAPLPRAGYDWHLNHNEDEVSLTYGMAESDDAPMDLNCIQGSRQLSILYTADEGSLAKIYLESGGDTEAYPAEAEPSALTDGVDLTAKATSTDPVFMRFRRLGWLAVHNGGHREVMVATHSAKDDIAQFFNLCEAGQ